MSRRERRIELLGFDDLWLLVGGIPLVGLIIPIVFFDLMPTEGVPFWKFTIISTSFAGIYWLVDRQIFKYLRKKYPGYYKYRIRIILQVVTVLAFTIGFCTLAGYILPNLRTELPAKFQIEQYRYVLVSLFITLAISASYESIYAIYLLKNATLEGEKLKKENLRSQLSVLKSQVNPHFLFNSLNTLSSIIPENPEQSVEFVQNLSRVYRYILEIKDQELISLRDELACIDAYRFLLKIRFGDNLKIETDIDPTALDKNIVPLSLQMLLENAIKHNVVSNKKPLTIKMASGENGRLIVSNNLQPKNEVEASTRTGLENINRRYRILNGEEAEVIVSETQFRVALPLIETEVYESTDH